MQKDNIEQILSIIKSDDLANKRQQFIEKYSINSNLLYPCFNSHFSAFIKQEISIEDFVNNVINSNLDHDKNFGIYDIISEYLALHLVKIEDLMDEKMKSILGKLNKMKLKEENDIDLDLGAKHISPELLDGVFNPFDDPELIVDEVVNVVGIRFKTTDSREKFYDVLIKFLRNIRNKYQTFEILIKSKNENGIGMSKLIADKVLDLAFKVKHEKETFVLEQKKTEIKFVNPIKKELLGDKFADIKKEEVVIKDLEIDSQKFITSNNSVVKESIEDDIKYAALEGSIEEMYLRQIKKRDEIDDMDIGPIHNDYVSIKLVGPIEELALFTIKDFRNLSFVPAERGNKIEQKIRVLESYSSRKKVLGIKAWLSSEVCSIYREMIDDSIKMGGIDKVINFRKINSKLFLTEDEVKVIADLNRRLRI